MQRSSNITTMQSKKGTVWSIPLPRNAAYSYTLFHRARTDTQGYTVIMVDCAMLFECHYRDTGFVTPEYAEWPSDKAQGIMEFMRPGPAGTPGAGSVELPVVGIRMRTYEERYGLLGLFKRSVALPVVSFTNGRHRTRFLQAMGVSHFPVEVSQKEVELMEKSCGF